LRRLRLAGYRGLFRLVRVLRLVSRFRLIRWLLYRGLFRLVRMLRLVSRFRLICWLLYRGLFRLIRMLRLVSRLADKLAAVPGLFRHAAAGKPGLMLAAGLFRLIGLRLVSRFRLISWLLYRGCY
jgi:hypothetical protein